MSQPLIVIQILPALNNGGVERGTVELANYLAQLGHTSIVISAAGVMLEKLSEKVEHINLNIGKKSLLTLWKIKTLRRIFIEKKVDIVHARSRLPAWLALKAISKIKSNKPKFITTVHGLYSVKKYSSIMARGDRVITVSKTATTYVKDHYKKYLKFEPCLIYRGISTKEFPYAHKPNSLWLQDFYKKHPQLLNHKMVLLPGRLSALKGAKELIIWLKSQDNKAKLVLTADPKNDDYAARLLQWFTEKNVEKRIVWIGIQSYMADLYALVDVVVNTSTRPESFGRTTAESLAIGTPTVGYDHGGVGEILQAIFPAGMVTLGHKQQLANTINKILKTKPIVPNKQPFLLTNMLQNIVNVYQDLCHEE